MAEEEQWLITGACGSIGAWVVRRLLRMGRQPVALDMNIDTWRLDLILEPHEREHVQIVQADVRDLALMEHVMRTTGTTHVIHLASQRMPISQANPADGAATNVVGTVNVFEAAYRAEVRRVVYASSVAAYGAREDYPERCVPHDSPPRPLNHYGVFKQANEGTARVFWLDHGISSIGLRPYVVYGPGYDHGLLAETTRAMLAAAAGRPYHVPFGGRFDLQYVDDVAAAFVAAAQVPFSGVEVFNLPGTGVHMRDVITTIEAVVPEMHGHFSCSDELLPFPESLDSLPLRDLLGAPQTTPLIQGVRETITTFRQHLGNKSLTVNNLV